MNTMSSHFQPPKTCPEGDRMMSLAQKLWPLPRSLSGFGVRQTLDLLKRELPALELESINSGKEVFDWVTPPEWGVKAAYIVTPEGERICDFEKNNLHLVGYSEPFSGDMELAELQSHLHSLEDQPEAIPYVTSYYSRNWGFCLSHTERKKLTDGVYRVFIDSSLSPGKIDFASLTVPGESEREIFFSTYICHPSLANNELSGPVLAVELAKLIESRRNYYTYRFIFVPETIGSIVYLSRNLDHMKKTMLAGYVLTCVGDEREYSYVPSREGDTVADIVAIEATNRLGVPLKRYSWLDRGSDERQYCSPGSDLPVCSLMRTKYGEYPEYHTSLDKLGTVVTSKGLQESFILYREVIDILEQKRFPRATNIGEPQLGRRNLYPSLSGKNTLTGPTRNLWNVMSLSDGKRDLHEIAEMSNMGLEEAEEALSKLLTHGLVSL